MFLDTEDGRGPDTEDGRGPASDRKRRQRARRRRSGQAGEDQAVACEVVGFSGPYIKHSDISKIVQQYSEALYQRHLPQRLSNVVVVPLITLSECFELHYQYSVSRLAL